MDGLAVADLKSVVAPLNFLVPMAEKPIAYNYTPPAGVPVRTGTSEEHLVMIRDARPLIGQLSLDKEGFVLLHHQSAVKNFYDDNEIKSVYYPECERVMKQATVPSASSPLTISFAMPRWRHSRAAASKSPPSASRI